MQPGVQAPSTLARLPFPPGAQKPAEQLQVEAALGARDLSRDYQRYATIFRPGSGPNPSFAEFLYRDYAARRRSGVVLAGIVAPILAGFTVMGTMLLYSHGKNDGGGFCNHPTSTVDTYNYYDNYYNYNDYDDDRTDCEGDYGEVTGMIIISSLGSLATIAVFTPGIIKVGRYNKRVRRLSPLVPESVTGPRFSMGLAPGGLSASLVF